MAESNFNSWQTAAAGDPLPPKAPLYQVRAEAEAKAGQALLEPGALVRIRGSQGMGKTSFIHQLLHHAGQEGCKTGYVSLAALAPHTFENLDIFLQEFCRQVSLAWHIPDALEDYWDDFFGVTMCCKSYFEEYLLPHISGPVVLALDDGDRLFPFQNVADDFFGLLRAWHEDAKSRAVWQQLRLIVAYSTDLYVPQNINKSPFNVGLPLELDPLTPEQIQALLTRWQVSLPEPDLEELAAFTGGRPHLVQISGYELSQNGGHLADLVAIALAPESPFRPSLERLQQALEQQPHLAELLTQAMAGQPLEAFNEADLYRLDSLGIINFLGQKFQLSCNLYAQWVKNR